MLSGVLVPFQDLLCLLPLGLEWNRLGIPFLDDSWYSIHGHNLSPERGEFPTEKYPMRTLGSLMLAQATWF